MTAPDIPYDYFLPIPNDLSRPHSLAVASCGRWQSFSIPSIGVHGVLTVMHWHCTHHGKWIFTNRSDVFFGKSVLFQFSLSCLALRGLGNDPEVWVYRFNRG